MEVTKKWGEDGYEQGGRNREIGAVDRSRVVGAVDRSSRSVGGLNRSR